MPKVKLPKPAKRANPRVNQNGEEPPSTSRRDASINPPINNVGNPSNNENANFPFDSSCISSLPTTTNKRKVSTPKKRITRKTPKTSFKTYTRRVHKLVNPNIAISPECLEIMDSFMFDIYNRLVEAACQLMRCSRRKVLTERDFQFAAKLVLPGSLVNYATDFARKAMILFKNTGQDAGVGGKRARRAHYMDNSLESPSLSQKSSESELIYNTFRSNIQSHSSPLKDQNNNTTTSTGSSSNNSSVFDDGHIEASGLARMNEVNSQEEEAGADIGQQIQEHLQNLPPPQRAPLAAFISCLPLFLRNRMPNLTLDNS